MSGKFLIIGENGQLARALQRLCDERGHTYDVIGSTQLDLATQPDTIADIISDSDAYAVINASAYTAVDAAEDDYEAALAVNAKAPATIAKACKDKDIPFVHISTDYVFDGTATTPYEPDHNLAPINAYGKSKAAGETAIMDIDGAATILRTSWVYDGTGKNFLTTMLRLGAERSELNVVHDQIGRPTYAGHLAEACLKVLSHPAPQTPCIYHVTNSGTPISWKDFAQAIFEGANLDCKVNGIPTTDYPTPAKRPAYSVLDISEFEQTFDHVMPDWQEGLKAALKERS